MPCSDSAHSHGVGGEISYSWHPTVLKGFRFWSVWDLGIRNTSDSNHSHLIVDRGFESKVWASVLILVLVFGTRPRLTNEVKLASHRN